VRAFMLTRLYVAAIHGSSEQGDCIVAAVLQRSWSLRTAI